MTVAPVSKAKQAARIDLHGDTPCNGPVSTLNATVPVMNHDELSDKELLLNARAGDEQSFEILKNRYEKDQEKNVYKWVLIYARGSLQDTDWHDIVLKVWFKVWRRNMKADDPQKVDFRDYFCNFLRQVTERTTVDELRKLNTRRKHFGGSREDGEDADIADRVAGRSLATENADLIDAVLKELKEHNWQIELILRLWMDDQTFEQIAKKVDRSTAYVWKLYKQGLEFLHKRLRRRGLEGEDVV